MASRQPAPSQSAEPSEYPATGRSRSSWLPSAIQFASVALLAGLVSTGGIYAAKKYGDMKQSEAPAADWFLWLCGQDKTWAEYQAEKRAQGNARIMDNEDEDYDWMQELVNDAYRGN